MAKKPSKPKIQPLIREEGVEHVLEAIKEMPELRSIGLAKLEGTQTWISYVLVSKGSEILSITVDEPNVRAIAEESAKINFVNEFMSQGI